MFKKREAYQGHTSSNFLSCCKPNKAIISDINDDYDIIRQTTQSTVSRTDVGSVTIIGLGPQAYQVSVEGIERNVQKKLSMKTKRLNQVRSKQKAKTFNSYTNQIKKCKSGSTLHTMRQQMLTDRATSRFNTHYPYSRGFKPKQSFQPTERYLFSNQQSAASKTIKKNYLSPFRPKPVQIKQYEKINVKKELQARKAFQALREQPIKTTFATDSLKLGSGLQTLQSEDDRSSGFYTNRSQDFWF